MSRLQIVLLSSFVCFTSRAAISGERIDLTPGNDPGQLTHVSIQLEAGGHNLVRSPQSQEQQDGKAASGEQTQPISVAAKLAYDEKRLATPTADSSAGTPLAVRYYDQAEAVIKVNETGRTPKLTDDKRTIIVEQGQQRPMAYCPDGPLSREQLDLVDVVGDSICINRLLPKQPVAEGESWANDATVMGPLLTFDTVAVCEVQCILDEFNANYAKVRLSGDVHGTADGAATQQEVRGVYLFDRKLRRITRLNLAVREKRSIGGATPGLDAVAKVQVKIDPIETSSHLSDEVVAKSANAARTPLHDLLFESPALGFRVKHDRQWYVTAERREAVTFRRVDGSDLVAQCTLTALPPKSAGRQTSLEQFQKRHYILARQELWRAGFQPPVAKCGRALLLRSGGPRPCRGAARRMALLSARPGKRQPRVRGRHDRKADARARRERRPRAGRIAAAVPRHARGTNGRATRWHHREIAAA